MRRTERDAEVDQALRRTLMSVPYPLPAQRAEVRSRVLALAAQQTPLPARTPSMGAAEWLRAHQSALMTLVRRILTDDSVYRRAKLGYSGRRVSLQYSPSVHFQPMW